MAEPQERKGRPSRTAKYRRRYTPLVPTDCERCGKVHARCSAHSREQGGGPCQRYPVRGGTVCATHGGSAPAVREAAARREVQAATKLELARAFQGVEVPEDVDPIDAYKQLFRCVVAEVMVLRTRVAELPEWEQAGAGGARKTHVLWEIYQERSRFMADLVVQMARLGIEERAVKVEEQKVEQLAALITAALEGLDLTPEQYSQALTRMAAAAERL